MKKAMVWVLLSLVLSVCLADTAWKIYPRVCQPQTGEGGYIVWTMEPDFPVNNVFWRREYCLWEDGTATYCVYLLKATGLGPYKTGDRPIVQQRVKQYNPARFTYLLALAETLEIGALPEHWDNYISHGPWQELTIESDGLKYHHSGASLSTRTNFSNAWAEDGGTKWAVNPDNFVDFYEAFAGVWNDIPGMSPNLHKNE